MPDVEELLGQMTSQEKVALLAGTHDWYTVPVERLGIPSLKMTDGPNGARRLPASRQRFHLPRHGTPTCWNGWGRHWHGKPR